MKYKVLVAEDELIERKVLCKTLNKYLSEFCDIFESRNGREALEVYQREQPHIAILDIEMPGINGLEVARATVIDSGCEVIFLTPEQKQEFRDAVKPLYEEYCGDYLELVQKIQEG